MKEDEQSVIDVVDEKNTQETAKLNEDEVEKVAQEAHDELQNIIADLNKDAPGIAEGLGAVIGGGLGGTGSAVALSTLGYSGLSAAGITSGLATTGGVVGGGMLAGMFMFAAPVALLAIGGYAIGKNRSRARQNAALSSAIQKVYSIQERLIANAEYFQKEIMELQVALEFLALKQQDSKQKSLAPSEVVPQA
ncbi:hypothetical protein [Thalassospira sp.]|uniref:hypothetical protein n=1 Tax=Thalassospira sp. TaxID=1912094 RepID=UPI0032EDA7F5